MERRWIAYTDAKGSKRNVALRPACPSTYRCRTPCASIAAQKANGALPRAPEGDIHVALVRGRRHRHGRQRVRRWRRRGLHGVGQEGRQDG